MIMAVKPVIAPLTKSQRGAATETYADVEKLIYDTAWKFRKQFGGDIDELIADANTHFMRAYTATSFDPLKSCFTTWVRNIVWRGLLADHTTARRRRVRVIPTDVEFQEPAKEDRSGKIGEMLTELSEDAKMVVSLVLQPPAELYYESVRRGDKPRNLRSALRDYLHTIGWGLERVAESFSEIKDVLSESSSHCCSSSC